jgi:hypothetical protein
MVNSAAPTPIAGHAPPSERLINEAQLIIYERWRLHVPHEEALYLAARFGLRARAIVASVPAADATVSP